MASFVFNFCLREFLLSAFANRFELRCEPKRLMLLYYKICPCSIVYFSMKGESVQVYHCFSCFKADFHSVEFSDWTGNLLFTCENFALNLNRTLRLTNV